MRVRANWDNPIQRNKHIKQMVDDGKIIPIIGAGFSMNFGVPSWPTLIDQLETKARIKKKENPPGLLRRADFIKQRLGSRFIPILRELIYKSRNINNKNLLNNPILHSIGCLITRMAQKANVVIINFNYDDLLIRYLELHGIACTVVDDFPQIYKTGQATCIHPHGIVFEDDKKDSSKDVVLDLKSYSDFINNKPKLSGYLNTVLLTKFSLILGLSGEDINHDRFFRDCFQNHPLITKYQEHFWGCRITKKPSVDEIKAWEERGIFSIPVKDYDLDYSNAIWSFSLGSKVN